MDTSLRREPDAKNRRSTRIVQAVPLTVTGVDALGRPFQERTSTLIINCQGCRYQSKHYVLKNMWLTFEVPHAEAGQPPRSVRARVTWVQRPRTVRELFQIGAELEASGNVWGVAFPPSDWTQVAGDSRAEIPAPAEMNSDAPAFAPSDNLQVAEDQHASPSREVEAIARASETVPPEPEVVAHHDDNLRDDENVRHGENVRHDDNVRMMPSPTAAINNDEALMMARQMGRLVNEARQQLQETVHTQATRAVSAEVRSMLLSIEGQLRDVAERSVQEAARAHGEEVLRPALENISQSEIARLNARWSEESERQLRDGIGRLVSEIDEIERRRHEELEASVQSRYDQARAEIESTTQAFQTESAAAQARLEQWRRESQDTAVANLGRWRDLAESSSAHAREQMTELQAAASRLSDRLTEATAEAESGWRGRLEADIASANARLSDRVETSLEGAARLAAERLARNSESSAHELERQIALRIEALGKAFTEATAEASAALAGLRAMLGKETGRANIAVGQLHEVATQIEGHAAALEVLRHAATDDLDHRGRAMVESHTAEMNERAEAIANSVAERMGPGLVAAGRQLLSGLAQEIEKQFAPQRYRAAAALRELEAGAAHAEAAARAHEVHMRELSDRAMRDVSARADQSFERLDAQFQQAGAAKQTRWLADLEAKANDVTHNAFESIFKSAEWYEKKVQTQMQATLEKGVAQAGESLRAKAGELSGLFAAELDHFTRSYVEHAKEQLDEQARAAAQRTREAAQEASDAVAAGFSERAAKIAAEQYQHLVAQTAAAQEHFSERIEEQRAETQSTLNDAAHQTATKFRADVEKQTEETLGAAKQQLDSQAATLTESWRAGRATEMQKQVEQIAQDLARLGNQAVEDYKQRLENSSNTWVLASVTKLNQHSQNLIEQLAASSEDRIRAACSGVFGEIGESLRQKSDRATDPDAPSKHDPDHESYLRTMNE